MKWEIIVLINLIGFSGYAAEQQYTLQLSDGSVQVGQNFINSFGALSNLVEDLGDVDLIPVGNLDNTQFNVLQNLLQQETQEAVSQEFSILKLEDQIEFLKIINFLAPKNSILGTFEYKSNNYLVKQLLINLQEKIEALQIDQEILNQLNQDFFINNIIQQNLQLSIWQISQRLGQIDNNNRAIGHTYNITSVAVSQDGNMIVTGSNDRTALVWEKIDLEGLNVEELAELFTKKQVTKYEERLERERKAGQWFYEEVLKNFLQNNSKKKLGL